MGSGASGVRRQWGPAPGCHSTALHRGALSLGFRADPLADETVTLAIAVVPALRPAHDRRLPADLLITGRPGGLLRRNDRLRRFVG